MTIENSKETLGVFIFFGKLSEIAMWIWGMYWGIYAVIFLVKKAIQWIWYILYLLIIACGIYIVYTPIENSESLHYHIRE